MPSLPTQGASVQELCVAASLRLGGDQGWRWVDKKGRRGALLRRALEAQALEVVRAAEECGEAVELAFSLGHFFYRFYISTELGGNPQRPRARDDLSVRPSWRLGGRFWCSGSKVT